jgi:hypothetical protein
MPDIGEQYPQPDPRGWLVFHGLPDDLQRAEDATQAHDFHCAPIDQHWDSDARQWYAERDATAAEKTLLAHLGHTIPAAGDNGYPLQTRVSYVTETLRCRRWLALETDQTTG